METLRLSYSILRHESRRAKVPLKLPTSGFVDVVAQKIMPPMTTLETEALRLQNKNSDLSLRTHPKIVLPTVDAPETAFGAMGRSYVIVPKLLNAISSLEVETLRLSHSILKHEERRVKEQLKLFSLVPTSASLMGIAFPPIVALTKKLAPAAAEMAFRFENFYKYVQEEAGGRHGAAFAPEHLKSGAIGTPGSNEMWHEKLWELLVATAVQEPDSLSVPSRLLNAHMKIQAIFPRITVVDFSHTLKKFSVRTPEERAVIIQSLAQRCPTQRPARIAISSQAPRPPAARHPDTWRGELRPSQAPPRTLGWPVQKKPALQAPPTDSISAMRKLWNEIQNYAEKDGKIYFNSAEGKVKLQAAIKHVWINNPDIPFEFMYRTVFRRVVFDTGTVEDMLRGTYNLISLQLAKFDEENIRQIADPLQTPHAQSSKALEDNDDDGNSMSFGHHICQ